MELNSLDGDPRKKWLEIINGSDTMRVDQNDFSKNYNSYLQKYPEATVSMQYGDDSANVYKVPIKKHQRSLDLGFSYSLVDNPNNQPNQSVQPQQNVQANQNVQSDQTVHGNPVKDTNQNVKPVEVNTAPEMLQREQQPEYKGQYESWNKAEQERTYDPAKYGEKNQIETETAQIKKPLYDQFYFNHFKPVAYQLYLDAEKKVNDAVQSLDNNTSMFSGAAVPGIYLINKRDQYKEMDPLKITNKALDKIGSNVISQFILDENKQVSEQLPQIHSQFWNTYNGNNTIDLDSVRMYTDIQDGQWGKMDDKQKREAVSEDLARQFNDESSHLATEMENRFVEELSHRQGMDSVIDYIMKGAFHTSMTNQIISALAHEMAGDSREGDRLMEIALDRASKKHGSLATGAMYGVGMMDPVTQASFMVGGALGNAAAKMAVKGSSYLRAAMMSSGYTQKLAQVALGYGSGAVNFGTYGALSMAAQDAYTGQSHSVLDYVERMGEEALKGGVFGGVSSIAGKVAEGAGRYKTPVGKLLGLGTSTAIFTLFDTSDKPITQKALENFTMTAVAEGMGSITKQKDRVKEVQNANDRQYGIPIDKAAIRELSQLTDKEGNSLFHIPANATLEQVRQYITEKPKGKVVADEGKGGSIDAGKNMANLSVYEQIMRDSSVSLRTKNLLRYIVEGKMDYSYYPAVFREISKPDEDGMYSVSSTNVKNDLVDVSYFKTKEEAEKYINDMKGSDMIGRIVHFGVMMSVPTEEDTNSAKLWYMGQTGATSGEVNALIEKSKNSPESMTDGEKKAAKMISDRAVKYSVSRANNEIIPIIDRVSKDHGKRWNKIFSKNPEDLTDSDKEYLNDLQKALNEHYGLDPNLGVMDWTKPEEDINGEGDPSEQPQQADRSAEGAQAAPEATTETPSEGQTQQPEFTPGARTDASESGISIIDNGDTELGNQLRIDHDTVMAELNQKYPNVNFDMMTLEQLDNMAAQHPEDKELFDRFRPLFEAKDAFHAELGKRYNEKIKADQEGVDKYAHADMKGADGSAKVIKCKDASTGEYVYIVKGDPNTPGSVLYAVDQNGKPLNHTLGLNQIDEVQETSALQLKQAIYENYQKQYDEEAYNLSHTSPIKVGETIRLDSEDPNKTGVVLGIDQNDNVTYTEDGGKTAKTAPKTVLDRLQDDAYKANQRTEAEKAAEIQRKAEEQQEKLEQEKQAARDQKVKDAEKQGVKVGQHIDFKEYTKYEGNDEDVSNAEGKVTGYDPDTDEVTIERPNGTSRTYKLSDVLRGISEVQKENEELQNALGNKNDEWLKENYGVDSETYNKFAEDYRKIYPNATDVQVARKIRGDYFYWKYRAEGKLQGFDGKSHQDIGDILFTLGREIDRMKRTDNLDNKALSELFDKEIHYKAYKDLYDMNKGGLGTDMKMKEGSMTLDDLQDMYNTLNGKERATNSLFARVMKRAKEMGVTVELVSGDHMPKEKGKVQFDAPGAYVNGTLYLNVDAMNSEIMSDRSKAESITHELIHSATQYAIDIVENKNHRFDGVKLDQKVIKAVATLQDVYDRITSDPSFYYNGHIARNNNIYGIESLSEMIAELSNGSFRKLLQEKGLWYTVKDAVKQIVGIFEEGTKTTSAYKEVNDAFDAIMDGYDEDVYKKYKETKAASPAKDNAEESKFLFVGKEGKGRLDESEKKYAQDNLDVAERMEKEKVDPRKIKLATGFERGADGKWRYEIGDAQFKAHAFDQMWDENTTLGDVLQPDAEVFKAYPELKDAKIDADAHGTTMGSYSPFKDSFSVNLDGYRETYNRVSNKLEQNEITKESFDHFVNQEQEWLDDTINHEIQHYIQEKEGFSAGDNPIRLAIKKDKKYAEELKNAEREYRDSKRDYDKSLKEYNELNQKLNSFYQNIGSGNQVNADEYNNTFEKAAEARKDIADKYKKLANSDSKLREVHGRLNEIGHQEYEKIAGEVEARNTEARMGMQYSERRGSLASETEDIPRDEQIVNFKKVGENETRIEEGDDEKTVSKKIGEGLDHILSGKDKDYTVTDKDGNMLIQKEGDRVHFSHRAYDGTDPNVPNTRDIIVEYATRKGGWDIVEKMDKLYDLSKQLLEARDNEGNPEYKTYAKWADTAVVLDKNGNPAFTIIKNNGEYPLNIDASTNCKKREELNAVLNDLIAEGLIGKSGLTKKDIIKLKQIITKHGLEIACDICFVDERRYQSEGQGKLIANDHNMVIETYLLPGSGYTMEDIPHFNYAGDKTIQDKPDFDPSRLNWAKLEDLAKKVNPNTRRGFMIYNIAKNHDLAKICDWTDFVGTEGSVGEHKDAEEGEYLATAFSAKYGNGVMKRSEPTAQNLHDIILSKKKGKERINPKIVTLDDGTKAWMADGAVLVRDKDGNLGWKFADGKKDMFDDSEESRQDIRRIGGVRQQSFSDAQAWYVFDDVESVADLALKHLYAHKYTKELWNAKMFGKTGVKHNLSAVPMIKQGVYAKDNRFGKKGDPIAAGLDENGELLWADHHLYDGDTIVHSVQSINVPESVRLHYSEGYSGDCGVIGVGTSDEQIISMQESPDYSMVIGFHTSLSDDVKGHTGLEGSVNYLNSQHERKFASEKERERWKSGEINSSDNKVGSTVKRKVAAGPDYNFYDSLDKYEKMAKEGKIKSSDVPEMAANEYLHLCWDRGYLPEFDQFAWLREDDWHGIKNFRGKLIIGEDGYPVMRPGYFKHLTDYCIIDGLTGDYAPQREVTMTFPEEGDPFGGFLDLWKGALKDFDATQLKRDAAHEQIKQEFREHMNSMDKLREIRNQGYDNLRHGIKLTDEERNAIKEIEDVSDTELNDMQKKFIDKYKDSKWDDDAQMKKVGQEEERTLAGVHNISQDKLLKAIANGGFANPSVAVIDTKTTLWDEFGDISLVMPSDKIDKKTGKNYGTWKDDVWTPMYPKVYYAFDKNSEKNFDNYLKGVEGDDEYKDYMSWNAKSRLNHGGEADLRWLFLKTQKGIDATEYDHAGFDRRWRDYMDDYSTSEELLEGMKKDPKLDKEIRDLCYAKVWDKYEEEHPEYKQRDGESVLEWIHRVRTQRKSLSVSDADVKEVFDMEKKAFSNKGSINNGETKSRAEWLIAKNHLYEEYENWYADFMNQMEIKGRLLDGYDRNGNPKYKPDTLENASKMMSKEQNKPQGFGGWGHFIKEYQKTPMSSLEEIRANKSKLSPEEGNEYVRKNFTDMVSMLNSKDKKLDLWHGDASRALANIVKNSNDIAGYAKKAYNLDLTDEEVSKIKEFADALRASKSKYFETKFGRPVMLDEFKAAVVPDDVNPKIRAALEKAGLKVIDYKKGDAASRQEAMNEAYQEDNVLFSKRGQERELTDIQKEALGLVSGLPKEEAVKRYMERVNKDQPRFTKRGHNEKFGSSFYEHHLNNMNPVYTGLFVQDVNELKKKYPSNLKNKYYDHVTLSFTPKGVSISDLGERERIHVIGRLTTDKVDALLVDTDKSSNKFPHITLATADGVKPYESNSEIEKNQDKIQRLDDYIDVRHGEYIGGKKVYGDEDPSKLIDTIYEHAVKSKNIDKADALVRDAVSSRFMEENIKERVEKLKDSEPVDLIGDEYVGKYDLNKNSAEEYVRNELRKEKDLTIKDTGEEVLISRRSAEKVTSHDKNNDLHLMSIAIIPEMIRKAIFIREMKNLKDKNGFDSYRYYVVGIKHNGEDYTAKIVMGKLNGVNYYDHSLTKIEKGTLVDNIDRIKQVLYNVNQNSLPGYKDKRLFDIIQVKPSKIVDSDGNLIKMYHTSPNKFTIFDENKINTSGNGNYLGNGFNFSSHKTNYGDNVIEAYLNAKSPLYSDKLTIKEDKIKDILTTIDAGTYGGIVRDRNREHLTPGTDEFNKELEEMIKSELKFRKSDAQIYSWICGYGGLDPSEIMNEFKRLGYDSVVIKDDKGKIKDCLVFDPSQIKSAETVTYDDNGSMIPLSERFNTLEDDFRFKKVGQEEDRRYMDAVKSGDTKTAEDMVKDAAKLAMPETKVVDENGDPLALYHGTRRDMFRVFDTGLDRNDVNIGSHFGSELAAETMGSADRKYKVYLNIKNPWEANWDYFANDQYGMAYDCIRIADKIGTKEARKLADEIRDLYPQTKVFSDESDYMDSEWYDENGETLSDTKESKRLAEIYRELLSLGGYDGIRYENLMEDAGHESWVALEPEQIKSADPVTYDEKGEVIPLSKRFDSSNEDIYFKKVGREPVREPGESMDHFKGRQEEYEHWEEAVDNAYADLRGANQAKKRAEKRNADLILAKNQVIQEIKDYSKNVNSVTRGALNRLMYQVANARPGTLTSTIRNARKELLNVRKQENQRRIDMMLAMKVKDVNSKNMSIAKTVSDSVRRIFEMMRGRVSDIKNTGVDEQMTGVRREIAQLQSDVRKLQKQVDLAGTKTVINGVEDEPANVDELKQMIEDKQNQIEQKKAELSNLSDMKEELTIANQNTSRADIDALIEEKEQKMQDASEGKAEWTQRDTEELTAYQILKVLGENDKIDAQIKSLQDQWEGEDYQMDNIYRAKQMEKDPAKLEQLKLKYKQCKARKQACEAAINAAIEQQIHNQDDAISQLTDLTKGGTDDLRARIESEKARKNSLIKHTVEDVDTGNPIELTGDTLPWYNKMFPFLPVSKKSNNTKENWFKMLFSGPLGSFEYMAQRITKNKLGKDGFFYKHFIEGKDGVIESYNKYLSGLNEAKDRLNAKTKELFGLEWDDAAKKFSKTEVHSGVYVNDMREGTGQGKFEKPLSKAQATYMYMVWKMPDGKAKMLAQGYDDDSMEQIRDFIGPKLAEWADWIQEDFLKVQREKYNEQYVKMYNTSMANIENYVPLKINKESTWQPTDTSGENSGAKTNLQTKNGSLINRKANLNPVDDSMSAFDVVQNHVSEMEEWNAFSRVRKDLDYVLSDTRFRNLLNTNVKGQFQDLYKAAQVAVMATPHEEIPAADEVFSKVSKGIIGGNIAYRVNTALKQVLSVPAFAGYSQDPKYMAHLLKNIGVQYLQNAPALGASIGTLGWAGKRNFKKATEEEKNILSKNINWCIKNIPDFRERVFRGTAGNPTLDVKLKDRLGEMMDKYLSYGMVTNQLVDAITCSIGVKSIYDYKYASLKKALDDKYEVSDKERETSLAGQRDALKQSAQVNFNNWMRYLDSQLASGAMTQEEYNNKVAQRQNALDHALDQFDKEEKDYQNKKKKEYEEARRMALMEADIYYNATQQSNHPAFMAPMQVSKSYTSRMLSAYQNASIGYARKMMESYYDLGRLIRGGRKMAEQYGVDDTTGMIKYASKNYSKNIVGLLLYGAALNWLWDQGGQGLLGFFQSDDEEEKSDDVLMNALEDAKGLVGLPGRGLPGVNMLTNYANGQKFAPFLAIDQLKNASEEISKAYEGSGFSTPVAWAFFKNLSRFFGVDTDVWTNYYLGMDNALTDAYTGIMSMVKDGELYNPDDKVMTLMFLLNSPNSNRVAVAKELYKEEGEEAYINAVIKASKYLYEQNDPSVSWIPGAKTLTKEKLRQIRNEFLKGTNQKLKSSDKEVQKEVDKLRDLDSVLDEFSSTSDSLKRKELEKKAKEMYAGDQFKALDLSQKIAELQDDVNGMPRISKDTYERMKTGNDVLQELQVEDIKKRVYDVYNEKEQIRKSRQSDALAKFVDEHTVELSRYNDIKKLLGLITTYKRNLGLDNDRANDLNRMRNIREIREQIIKGYK